MPNSKNRREKQNRCKSSARKRRSRESVAQSSAPLVAAESMFHLMGMGSINQSDDQRRAQELVYEAWERAYPRDRVKLAKQALELWPDCADAWVLLANNMAESMEEAHELYTAGVKAGERALEYWAELDGIGRETAERIDWAVRERKLVYPALFTTLPSRAVVRPNSCGVPRPSTPQAHSPVS